MPASPKDIVRLACAILVFLCALPAQSVDPRNYAVEASATVQTAPPQITLQWTPDASATGYSVYRKAPAASSWNLLTALPGTATSWADSAVSIGTAYEY